MNIPILKFPIQDETRLEVVNRVQFKNADFVITPFWGGNYSDVSEFLWFFQYEMDIRERWWNINPGEIVFDIGCRVGSWTLPALALGAELVFAIDPCPNSYFTLATQLLLNHFQPRCVHGNWIVGKENKICDFDISLSRSESDKASNRSKLVCSLDYTTANYELQRVDWIKIDVEGSELEVLQGAEETLTRFSPTVICEYHDDFIPGISDQCRDFMKSLGYVETFDGKAHGLWKK